MIQWRRSELGDFLRRRREALTPAAAGVTAYGRRRTPGLRRDEVAGRAHMSAVYYERLEQGRGPSPSAAMLDGLARALVLTGPEREHLYRLAGQAAPVESEPVGFVDPELLTAMDTLAPGVPAEIIDDIGTVLVQNRLDVELFGELAGDNRIWRWFAEPGWRDRTEPQTQHQQTSHSYAAALRSVLAHRDRDPRVRALVDRLLVASPEFAALWAEHSVTLQHCPRLEVLVERVGRIDLDCTLMLSRESSQQLLLLRPVDAVAAERLARLS